jgi:hypothetical protein
LLNRQPELCQFSADKIQFLIMISKTFREQPQIGSRPTSLLNAVLYGLLFSSHIARIWNPDGKDSIWTQDYWILVTENSIICRLLPTVLWW